MSSSNASTRSGNSHAAVILMLVSAAVLTVSTGLRQSFGLFLPPMSRLGITASGFGFAIALQSIVWGISQPFIGMLADRYGTRAIVIGAALTFASGLVVMATAASQAGLLAAGVLTGLGVAGTGLGVVMGTVSRAVAPERRSQSIGTVAAAGSLGTLALAPLGQWLIVASSWRTALWAFSVIAAAMVPVALAFGGRKREAQAARATAQDDRSLGDVLWQAATHPGYLAMTAAFFACGFQLMFITVHLPSYLAWCGLPAALGGTAIGLIGLCNTFGTYGVGLLGARYPQKRLLALVYLLRTLAIIAFLALPVSPASTLVFAAAMGLLWLSVAPLVSGLVGKVFGLKHFGTLYGLVFLSHQLGSFAGSLLGGVVFDRTGSYGLAWGGLIVIGLTAFVLQWPMDDRTPSERERSRATKTGLSPVAA